MKELIRDAANGWFRYTEAGKYAVLLLGLLLWLGYLKHLKKAEEGTQEQQNFWWYTAVSAALAIFPLSAAVWMGYQTRFYDYEWIWSAVPVTGFIAAAAAGLYAKKISDIGKNEKWKIPAMLLCGLAAVWLCGSMGTERVQGMWMQQNRYEAQGTEEKWAEDSAQVLLTGYREVSASSQKLCVWASSEVLMHIREQSGEICLLYGRNMWEDALNAYSYDMYDAEVIRLYEWMEELNVIPDEGVVLPEPDKEEAMQMLHTALSYGVNCMVFPGNRAMVAEWAAEAAMENGLQMIMHQAGESAICYFVAGNE